MFKCPCDEAKCRAFGFLALRLAVGSVLIYHGWVKLQDLEMVSGFFSSAGIPAAGVAAWIAGLLEFFGGIAIVLGVYVKSVASLVAIEMLIALLVVHTKTPWIQAELAVLVLGSSLFLAGNGAGEWRALKGECLRCTKKGKK